MGRSNNQMRRTAKAKGRTHIPKLVKSKLRNTVRRMKINAVKGNSTGPKKLSYSKIQNKDGRVVQRKFQAGGYNNSGKFGKATGAKNNAHGGKTKKR